MQDCTLIFINNSKSIIKNSKYFFVKNSSAIILLVATLSFFLSNLLIKVNLDSVEYGKVALLFSYFSLLTSFGLFGSEQLIIRNSIIKENDKIWINFSTCLIVLICFVCQLIFPLIFHKIYGFDNLLLGVILSCCITFNTLAYCIFRLLSSFNISQFCVGSWKILSFFIIVILLFFSIKVSYKIIEIILVCGLLIFFIIFSVLVSNKVEFEKPKITFSLLRNELHLLFYFFLSLFSLSFLALGDRFLIAKLHSDYYFVGEYLFLGTLIVFPYNLFQNYFGFIYMVEFKNSNDFRSMIKIKLSEINKVSFFLTTAVIILLITMIELGYLNKLFVFNNMFILVFMFITGIIKLYYSVYSSIMGIYGSINVLKKSNLITIFSIILAVLLILAFPNKNFIVFCFASLWGIRVFLWHYFIINEIK